MSTGGALMGQQGTSGGGTVVRVGMAPSVLMALLALLAFLAVGCARSPDVPPPSAPATRRGFKLRQAR